jgi:hypothetical protein
VRSHCPLCRARKGKRACPAKGESICAACCGAKRRVEIDCPDDCVYLTGAHAGAWDGRETERRRDLRRFAAHLSVLDERQLGLFFLTLSGLAGLRARHRDLNDRLLHSALQALRRTVETREKGVLYEHVPDDARAAGLAHDLAGLFEARSDSGQPVAPADRDLAAVLKVLDDALHDALREAAGPLEFLDSVTRLAGRLGAAEPQAPAAPLILEP